MAQLFTLTSFSTTTGYHPNPRIVINIDTAGNLFGTTTFGATGYGTVFVLKVSAYASSPITLYDFGISPATNGFFPIGGLISDNQGNLFGTTNSGGLYWRGAAFEIVKTANGYASSPKIIASFNSTDGNNPNVILSMVDSQGNLIGTTEYSDLMGSNPGVSGYGSIVAILKTSSGYASSPITLVSFNGTNGANPRGGLIADSFGNLYGTTSQGGAFGRGTVFEIIATAHGYDPIPKTIVNFNGTDGEYPSGSLIIDSVGNLFGTTTGGGAYGAGTVFKIANTDVYFHSDAYASSPTTLVSFKAPCFAPSGTLIMDSQYNLFGTTADGTVFEIPWSPFGYATSETTVVDLGSGVNIGTDLVAYNGKLYGTTLLGGSYNAGSIYEVFAPGFNPRTPGTSSNFTFADFTASGHDGALWQRIGDGLLYQWQMNGTALTGGGAVATLDPAAWTLRSTADFNGDGKADLLWQHAPTGQIWLWQMNGTAISAAQSIGAPDPAQWKLLTTGDFNGDGKADLMFQQVGTGLLYAWTMNGPAVVAQGAVATLDPALWTLRATTDFNGDGAADLMWQNTATGEIWLWEMNGNAIGIAQAIGTLDLAKWKLLTTGDFNGDGKADILFQQAGTGLLYEWQMNGTAIAAQGGVATLDPAQWTLLKAGDFSGDGKTDLLWQHVGDGLLYAWQMDGTAITGGGGVGTLDPGAWKLLA
ncbi:MAG: choice-of-anchor tandem repeat GloVer-containing protein [Paracraurococcus sp.]